jgi:hypothetical protein
MTRRPQLVEEVIDDAGDSVASGDHFGERVQLH